MIQELRDLDLIVVCAMPNSLARPPTIRAVPAAFASPHIPMIVSSSCDTTGLPAPFARTVYPEYGLLAPGVDVRCAAATSANAVKSANGNSFGRSHSGIAVAVIICIDFTTAATLIAGTAASLVGSGDIPIWKSAADKVKFILNQASWPRQPHAAKAIWNLVDGSRDNPISPSVATI